MQRLHILYDAECELCRRVRVWLGRQATFVPLVFIPLQSPEIATRFPTVEALHPELELVVISDTGDLWQGGAAWITVLWALKEYRSWAQRLAHPALVPLARRACALVSENRQMLSRWLAQDDPERLRARLATLPDPACAGGKQCRRS